MIAFRDMATTQRGSSIAPVLNLPPSAEVSDLLLAIAGSETTHALGLNPNWVQVGATQAVPGPDSACSILRRFKDGSEGSQFTLNFSVAENMGAVVVAYSDVDPSEPIHQIAQGVAPAGDSVSTPTITTTVPNCMILGIVECDPSGGAAISASPDTSPGATERADFTAIRSTFSDAWIYVQEFLQTSPGPVSLDLTGITPSGVEIEGFSVFTIALTPVSVPSGGDPLSVSVAGW